MLRVASLIMGLMLFKPLMAGAGLDQLNAFTNELVSYSADFTQTVYDAKDNPVKESSGSVVLMRPGRFAWDYKEPSEQKIVADGEKIWVYDVDLAQVTVRKIDATLGSTPIMLLGGDQPLDSEFNIKELGNSDGINWLELTPKQEGAEFEKVFMGVNAEGLAAMELRDNFGQATQIRFTDIDVNGPVVEGTFDFTPPEGVDVVGE